jgi:4-amino-4-deoxy-L-arabinose transferase-like glycosyltransferase
MREVAEREYSCWVRVLLIIAIWAACYLPALGVQEFKSEEMTRVAPALVMLDGGSWWQPQLYGQPYHNKPPGINWSIAASMSMLGRRDEVGARAAGVLATLVLALAFALAPQPWIGPRGRLLAASAWLVNLATLEKGRLSEIEALLVPATGLALVAWIVGFSRGALWMGWIAMAPPLAVTLLLKGPMALPAFYLPIVFCLWRTGRWTALFAPAHWIAAVLAVAPLAVWMVFKPVAASVASAAPDVWGTWIQQLAIRFNIAGDAQLGRWAWAVVQFPLLLLPWGILIARWWHPRALARLEPSSAQAFRGLRDGGLVCYALFCLMPELRSRYLLPLVPLSCWLIAWQLERQPLPSWLERIWRGLVVLGAVLGPAVLFAAIGLVQHDALSGVVILIVALGGCVVAVMFVGYRHAAWGATALALGTAWLAALVIANYGALAPIKHAFEDQRPAARALDHRLPAGETLYMIHPGAQGRENFLLYFKRPVQFVARGTVLDGAARYLLVQERDELDWLSAETEAAGLRLECLLTLDQGIPGRWRMLRRSRR